MRLTGRVAIILPEGASTAPSDASPTTKVAPAKPALVQRPTHTRAGSRAR
jgi:hypothetical protein